MKNAYQSSKNILADLEDILSTENSPKSSNWKCKLFEFYYALIPDDVMSPIICCILILVSFCQTLSLMIFSNVSLLNLFRLIPELIDAGSSFLSYAVLSFVSCLVIFVSIMSILAPYLKKHKRFLIICEIINACHWIAIIPITELFLMLFSCDDEGYNILFQEVICWNKTHFIHICCFALPILCWLFLIVISASVAFFPHNHATNPFSHFPWNFEFLYTFFRICFLILNCQVFTIEPTYYISICVLLFSFECFSILKRGIPYYNKPVSVVFTGSIYCIAAISFTHWGLYFGGSYFFKNFNGEIVIYFCCPILLFPMIYFLGEKRRKNIFSSTAQKTAAEIDVLAHLLIKELFIRPGEIGLTDLFLKGYLETKSLFYIYGQNVSYSDSSQRNIKLCNSIINFFQEDLHDNSWFHMQKAELYLSLFNNEYMALIHIICLENQDPSFFIQMLLFCLKQRIAKKLHIKRKHENLMPFSEVFRYEYLFSFLKEQIVESSNMWLDFWTQLKGVPDLNELHELGMNIYESKFKIKEIRSKLESIFPFDLQCITLYSKYVSNVCGESQEGHNLEAKIYKRLHLSIEDIKISPIFSEKSAVVLASGNPYNLGIILKASNNISKIFGYNSSNLINHDLGILMPKIFAKIHRKILRAKLANSTSIEEKYKEYFAMHKNGFIIPIKMAKQTIFTLNLGMLFIANIQINLDLKGHGLILTNLRGKVLEMSESIGKRLAINPTIIHEGGISIYDLCPKLGEYDFESNEGMVKLTFFSYQKNKEYIPHDESKAVLTAKCEISTLMETPIINKDVKLFKLSGEQEVIERFPFVKKINSIIMIDTPIIPSISFQQYSRHSAVNMMESLDNRKASADLNRTPTMTEIKENLQDIQMQLSLKKNVEDTTMMQANSYNTPLIKPNLPEKKEK